MRRHGLDQRTLLFVMRVNSQVARIVAAGLSATLVFATGCGSETETPPKPAADAGTDGSDAEADAPQDSATESEAAPDAPADVTAEASDAKPDAFDPNLPLPAEDWSCDIVSTDLSVDMEAMTATATVTLAPSVSTACSLDAAGLQVGAVRNEDGPLNFAWNEGRLDVGIPASATATRLEIDYGFEVQPLFMGYMDNGATLTWPYYCGNLFPCHPDPADGLRFTLDVHALPAESVAIYPASIDADVPSYQLAWAIGDYTRTTVGTTTSGTTIHAWTLPGTEADATVGTAELVDVFSWYEQTLGPYPFGAEAGPVAVEWGLGGGGMEHHPYWHVDVGSMGDREVHAHEAAHGWFGDGVRLRCYEDLVLSEGTATYLAARVLGQVAGPGVEAQIWSDYQEVLDIAVGSLDAIAWPDTCGEIDVLEGGSFMVIPYMKGAFFYRALADEIGADALDQALGVFFLQHVGTAAGMQDLLDTVQQETGYDPTSLAQGWLKSMGVP